MKRTLLFLIAMVAMVSAKATVTVEKLPISGYWTSTINGTNNFQVNFKEAWGEYKLTTTNFSIATYPRYRIYYQILAGSFQVKTQNGTDTGDSDGQQETLDSEQTSYESTFNPATFGEDKTIVKFEIQAKEANSSIRIEKIALLDGSDDEHLQYDGSLVWGGTDENPIIYYGADMTFTAQYAGITIPVAAMAHDGEIVTYTVTFREALPKAVGFNAKYSDAPETEDYSWPVTPAGSTQAVFTFTNTSAKNLINLTLGDKTASDFENYDVNIASITRTTTYYNYADLAPAALWIGNKELTGWTPGDGLNLNLKDLGVTSEGNLYLLVDHAGDLRITRNSNGWEDWPSAGFNHCTGNIDANNIIKVELPQDFVDAVTEGEGDGYWHEIVLWGDGLTIKGIATTKETLLNKIHTDANGYATYSSNYTLALDNLPAGLEAYTAALAGTTLSFTQKEVAVGAETGLLFKGEANTDYFIPAKTDATAAVDNALKAFVAGGALASTVSEYIFVMKKATSAGTLTFQKLSTTGVTMPANKAYVQVAASAFTSAHELSISFGDEDVTAINAVKDVTKADNRYYNLSGQVVANPTKGIYILNGKKVVIK